MKHAKDVEEYIEGAPEEVQGKLRELRALIKSVAPEALEKISYGMPAYYDEKRGYRAGFVSFANFKNHLGLFVTPSVLDSFADEVKKYRTSKATLRLDFDKKLPIALIKKLAKVAVKKNKTR